jgi:7-cyano-7-deazaguanine synthase
MGCAIVGALAVRPNAQFVNRLHVLMERSTNRGSDSWGWVAAMHERVGYKHNHELGKFTPTTPLDLPVIPDGFTGVATLRGEPATEWVREKSIGDIPPFASPSKLWVFAHNGTIANDKALLARYGDVDDEPPTAIDSYVIGILLDRFGWKDTVEMLEGSFALVGYNITAPGTMWWAANYKPLYLLAIEGGALFASQREYFTGFYNPLVDPSPVQLGPYEVGNVTTAKTMHRQLFRLSASSASLYPVHTPTPDRALVVCSGGLDSATVAYYLARKVSADITLLHIRYNCHAESRELLAVEALAKDLACDLRIITTDFFQTYASSILTRHDQAIAPGEAGAELAHEWVPARNLIMASLALAVAEVDNFDLIAFGTNQEEGCAFADNEQETWNKLRELIPFAVKPYRKIAIADPLGGLMKHEIVRYGVQLGVPHQYTYSCYKGGELHCGECGPCHQRRIAFRMANVPDPTRYMEVSGAH